MTTATGETRVFRGASLEEILPRIREELGPDAVVVREREGLVGGIAGFFARRCIEVEAAPGWPTGHDDVVLTLPAQDAAESYAAAAPLEIGGPGIEPGVNSFMEALLDRAAALDELFVPTAAGPEASVPASAPMQVSAPPRQVEVATPPLEPRPRTSRRLIEEVAAPAADAFAETEAGVRIDLRRSGMSESAIDRVLVTVRNHLHPLSPTAGLRESARLAVRSSIATPVGWRDRRTIGFAGLDDAAAARAVA
ncbi:MAG: hypothetical protein FJW96_17575, partial [Actinobacteria bacterium]|nr:hypothetical protein [Actinomycetota bacterium]